MKTRISNIGPYILLGISFLLVIFLNVSCYDHWLDSDMAAEMIFSKLLAEEGRLFATPDWYYSTEFRFLYTHLIMGPLFRICENWHLIRGVTNVLSYTLMLGSYYYCMKPLQVRKELVIGTSAILLLPFSETMMTHMIMGNTYMFHVMIVFAFFGLYLRLVQGNLGKWFVPDIILFIGLAFICGVSGVRYLLALQCPLVLAAFVYLWGTESAQSFRRNVTGENFFTEIYFLWKSDAMNYLRFAALGAVGSVAGYGINVVYVSKNYVFQTYDATNFIAVYQGVFFERLQNALGSLLMLFGYIPDRGVISLRGVVTMAAFVMIGVWCYVCGRVCKKALGKRKFVCLFLVVSFALNLFVFVFTTSTMVPRYYLTIFIFVLPVLCFYLEQEELYFDKAAVLFLLTACLVLATGKTVLSYAAADKNADKRQVADFLQEQNYTFGYATYWNANIITELTDGKVEVANILNPESMEYFKWSSPMKYYEEGYAEGEVFLLISAEELIEWADCAVWQKGTVVYEDEYYTVFVYESAKQLLEENS